MTTFDRTVLFHMIGIVCLSNDGYLSVYYCMKGLHTASYVYGLGAKPPGSHGLWLELIHSRNIKNWFLV